ncbi:PRTRC system ParB family protein [Methylophaga sp.]|jgi:PRTRC genetic system ParB family protein|nr:PRTRC system ParB family protein [Methylophaga sp.]HIC46581.1 PRTRC system ParB family protein [Methylophaga sp.]
MNAPLANTQIEKSVSLDIEDVMANVYDKQMIHLPINMISVREGFNPRRYFSEDRLNEMVASIQAQGILQPIVIKPSNDGKTFYLIAGERRYRAATIADVETVPAMIRLVSDEEALAMAVAENSERQDVSAAEEAKACQRMLTLCKGDRTEAALALGWTEKKLEARLTLLHCTDSVLDALDQRKIAIGHAELFAGLTAELQDSILVSVIEKRVSVSVLRDQLGKFAFKLSDAVFNLTGCNGCPHNSSITADLFDESLSDGHCLNRDCYENKTRQHLEEKKTELSQEYPVIWLDVERPADTRCHLMREGEKGVGREQYSACQGCGNFGALMNTAKGKEGQIETGLCFDVSCNSQMVKAHQDELEIEQQKVTELSSPTHTTAIIQSDKPKERKKSADTPKRVKEYIQGKQYKAAAATVWSNTKLTKVMSLIALTEAIKHV